MLRKHLHLTFLMTLFLMLSASLAQAQQTIRVLAIGNSFSEDAVEQNLYEMAREAGYELIIGNAYRGGQGLESHWNVVNQKKADFEYRKVVRGQKTNRTQVLLDDIVTDEPWDIITFQQVSQDAGLYSTYFPYLRYLIRYVNDLSTASEVRYGFHQTWAYSKNSTHGGFANYDRDQLKMYRAIVSAVRQAVRSSAELTFVVPSGSAIQNARTSGLGDYMNRDGYHLDYNVGRYTAACTWLETITGVSPTEITYRPSTVSADQASIVRKAAHDAVVHPDIITPQESGIDSMRISMFGSSVAYGSGADKDQGYAYLYDQQLQRRTRTKESQYPLRISNISIGGNRTVDLLNRYKDLIYDLSRFVLFGLSLGNEGIHDAADQEAVFRQWRDNMLTLIAMARADGKIPVVMNNYTRGDYNASDYEYVRRLNLLIHEWDVPSVSTLGAIDSGQGRWATGYQGDTYHPNTSGHREIMYAIPPSLFDALAEGKPLPVRDRTQQTTLTGADVWEFTGEGTLHPFAVSFTFKGTSEGILYTLHSGSREARIGINSDRKAYYVALTGDSLVCETPLTDDWHTITLSHYYAARRTLFYVDNEGQERSERIAAGRMTLGYENGPDGVSRDFGELMFWRSALNPDEIAANVKGTLLKSSLEIYMPLSETQKTEPNNLAQSLNQALFLPNGVNHVRSVNANSNDGPVFDLSGRPLPANSRAASRHKGIRIQRGKKYVVR